MAGQVAAESALVREMLRGEVIGISAEADMAVAGKD